MTQLGKVSIARHITVGVAIVFTTGLAAFGVVGGGIRPERFDAKTIVVEPVGSSGLRITEYVDQDFGSNDRHGYERIIPNDFGVPTDVTASSPDAPDGVSVVDEGSTTRIRIGDPNVTISGQHRYELAYTLPDAKLDLIGLALDVVAPKGGSVPGDLETEHFEVLITGMLLSNIRCDTGPAGATGGCTVERDTGYEQPVYRTVMEPLPENDGLSIFADIEGLVAPATIEAPPIPDRRPDRRLPLALAMPLLGLVGAFPVYRWARRKGRNEVYAGGAADAAYGSLPSPRADGSVEPPPPVTLVADDDLAALATIEFVPPKGIAPWQAQVLLTERIDSSTVTAWFSGLAGVEAITLDNVDSKLQISGGPKRGEVDGKDAELLDALFVQGDPYVTGTYDPGFAAVWASINAHQRSEIGSSGWWKRLPPGGSASGGCGARMLAPIIFLLLFFFITGSVLTAFVGVFQWLPLAALFGLAIPAIVAYFVYRALLPARSAQGSALALRSESFRRFLAASEGTHVEWAWTHGVLREYSGWAVALGEADAWNRALANANVPAPAQASMSPLLVYSMGSSMMSSHTAPSSSSSSGGGSSFSGGGSGGGGGGGSSGSW